MKENKTDGRKSRFRRVLFAQDAPTFVRREKFLLQLPHGGLLFPSLKRTFLEAEEDALAADFGRRQPSGTLPTQRSLASVVHIRSIREVAFRFDAGEGEQCADFPQLFQQEGVFKELVETGGR